MGKHTRPGPEPFIKGHQVADRYRLGDHLPHPQAVYRDSKHAAQEFYLGMSANLHDRGLQPSAFLVVVPYVYREHLVMAGRFEHSEHGRIGHSADASRGTRERLPVLLRGDALAGVAGRHRRVGDQSGDHRGRQDGPRGTR